MRVAQVAPLYEAVPPKLYGGTERVVAHLTEELVNRGHDVTLFASGDSETRARLAATRPHGLRLDPGLSWDVPAMYAMMEEVRRRIDEFDIVHFHTDCWQLPFFREHWAKTISTMHGRLDIPDIVKVLPQYPPYPLVSISHSQRAPLPAANWAATVYHGYPESLYRFSPQADGYLAFLGRISPEKGPHRAIEIATRAGQPLRIAAKVDLADRDFHAQVIEPMLAHPLVTFVGEIDDAGKSAFLGGARALLVPIEWPEPFGLVMIEAMACGTPVIAFNRGSVSELVEHEVTGFIVETVEEAVAALGRLGSIDRRVVRERFEARFSVTRMTDGYLAAYDRVLSGELHRGIWPASRRRQWPGATLSSTVALDGRRRPVSITLPSA